MSDEACIRERQDIRINLTIYRDENPLLAEHLMALPKGGARARRLTTLALVGLLTERGTMVPNRYALVPAPVLPQVQEPAVLDPPVSEDRSDRGGYQTQLTPEQLADLLGGRRSGDG
jgi:hypothetical protein